MTGNKKVWTTYADDIELIAKREEEIKNMIGKFKRYLEKKKLPVKHRKDEGDGIREGRRESKEKNMEMGK